MSREDANFVEDLITKQQTLTSKHEMWVQDQVRIWTALRESDNDTLKSHKHWPAAREYINDPLPERIADAFADFLFGEDPRFLTQTDEDAPRTDEADEEEAETEPRSEEEGIADDQDRLEELVNANNLPSELREAVKTLSSEGEVWWRIYKDTLQSDYPVIEWHSRAHVRPVFRGRKLVAAAFVSDLHVETLNDQTTTWKYVEIQTDGYVRNLLFKGSNGQLGNSIPLKERPETADLPDEWAHGLGMLAGRIVNRLGRDKRYGVSDYKGVKELLFSLNEATTIGHENARLTLKKRIAVPRESLDVDGKFDAGEDVLVSDGGLDDDMGSNAGSGKFTVLEYSFDAQALISYKNDVSNTILTRVGLARQFTDPNAPGDGQAASGTALRVRLIPTTLAAKGKARSVDDELPTVVMLAQQLDALPTEHGGFGRQWQQAAEPPVIERGDPIPVDRTEETARHSQAVTSELESRFTAIQELHPDWDTDKVNDELARIYDELQQFSQAASGGAPPPPGELPEGGELDPEANAELAEAGAEEGDAALPPSGGAEEVEAG